MSSEDALAKALGKINDSLEQLTKQGAETSKQVAETNKKVAEISRKIDLNTRSIIELGNKVNSNTESIGKLLEESSTTRKIAEEAKEIATATEERFPPVLRKLEDHDLTLSMIEMQRKERNLRIRSVPESEGDNLVDYLTKEFSDFWQQDLEKEEFKIESAFRLGTRQRRNKARDCLITLRSKEERDKILNLDYQRTLQIEDYFVEIFKDIPKHILVVSTNMDKAQRQVVTKDGRLPKTFFEMTDNMDLVDIWRIKHPLEREGTFFSEAKMTWTRIDQIWVTRGMAPKIKKVEICPKTCSDHNAVKMVMKQTTTGTFRWRMNDTLFGDEEVCKKAQKTLKDYFEINMKTNVEKRVIWDASKAVMRGFLIQQNAIKKRSQNEKKENFLEKIKDGERKLRSKPKSHEILREIKLYQTQYMELMNQEIEWKIKQMRQKTFESADKCGKLLAWQIKKRQKLNTVTNLEVDGKNIYNPTEIRNCFQRYFRQLYSQGPQKDMDIEQFLGKNGLKKISQESKRILNQEITEQEIEGAIQNMALGKSPGPDGLTSRYYKVLKEWLSQPLKEVCNEIMEGKRAPDTWKETYITLIPKTETEKTQLKNYRPISLLNVDYKIFADILAKRLKIVLMEEIHRDQAGFLPRRHLSDNVRNIIDILEKLEVNINTKAVLIFVDAEKAFDNISWSFMMKNLRGMGVGQGFENGIGAIYSEQKAKFIVNNVVTEEFKIEKGTCQGCPISPLLFISVLEVLLNMIRRDQLVKGVQVGAKQYKLRAFADDLVLTLQEPESSTKRVLELIQEFGQVAGFKLNKLKIKVLEKKLTPFEKERFQNETGLTVVKKVKYLGINMTAKNVNLFKDNYEKSWTEVKKDLEIWSNLKLSLLGRIAVIKMNVLPRMLFLFQTLQIMDKMDCFKKWQKDISKFVWQGKKPRIKFKILTDAKERGGFALPDFKLYYESAAFCWLKDWLLLENTDILDLECFNNTFGWHAYLWYDKAKAHKGFKNHIVRKALYNVWTRYKDLLENKTPRWLSPMEAKAVKKLNMESKWPRYWEILEQEGDRLKLQSFEKLKGKVRDWLHYYQIMEVFKMDRKIGFQMEKSKLETELLESSTKNLSKMYNLLLKWNTQDETVKSAMIKWAQDIGHNIMFVDWEKLRTTEMKFTACNALRENIMKMIYRWYMTPVSLQKFITCLIINAGNAKKMKVHSFTFGGHAQRLRRSGK
uniref:Reverse transcriptase domain-containing protein n=1 Tax=Podarcis muralis TaxID=64176 RepID=A0A670JUF4_PODMU